MAQAPQAPQAQSLISQYLDQQKQMNMGGSIPISNVGSFEKHVTPTTPIRIDPYTTPLERYSQAVQTPVEKAKVNPVVLPNNPTPAPKLPTTRAIPIAPPKIGPYNPNAPVVP